MAQKILNMIFRADTAQAKAAIDDLQGREGQPGGVSGLGFALSRIAPPAAIAAAAIGGVNAVLGEIDSLNEYVLETQNLAYSLGLTTEEASFLMSQMERYRITNDTMVAVFRKLASEGVDPTIDSLKVLLEQWEAMEEGAEKGQFAMEMFGEQGIKQILPWWERLTEEQRKNFGVQTQGLRVTEEMYQVTQEYDMAVADLTDEWGNFKVEMLSGVIPALTQLLGFLLQSKSAIEGFGQSLQNAITGGFSGSGGGVNSAAGQAAGMALMGGNATTIASALSPNVSSPYSGYNPPGGSDGQTAAAINNMVAKLPTLLVDTLERR